MSFETTKVENDIQFYQDKLATLEYSIYGYGGPGYNMNKYKTTSSRYAAAKKEFDERFPEYQAKKKELETKISGLKTELDVIVKKEDVAKKTKKAKEDIDKAKDDIQRAKDAKDAEAEAAAEEALKAARIKRNEAEGTTPKNQTEGLPSGEVDGNIYADYTVDAKGNVTNKEGKTVVFVESKNEQGDILPKEYTSSASARDAFLKNYSQPGQLDQLKKDLIASGYLKESEKNSPNWIGAVDDLIIAHTRKSVVDVKYGGLKQPVTIDFFMKEKKAGSGTGGTKTYREYSSRGDASRMLDGYFNDLLGYGATPEEEDAFYKELRAAEDKAFRTVTDGRTGVGGFLEDADRLLIAAKIAKKAIKNTDVEALLKSGQGSQVAMDIADLQATANSYGIELPSAEALKYVVAGVGQKDYIAKQQERLRQLSMTMHPYLKDHIAAGGTVKDVADEYGRTKANKLGIVVANSIKDKDVMSAVASGKSVVDFERELQMDPLWRKTPEARKVANDFANTMIQTFGLG